MNLGCDGVDWVDCNAGLPRQDAVIQTQTVRDHGGANKWAFGPVDLLCGV